MKKVLFVIPTLGGGGAEKVLVNLVNNMNLEKFDVSILTLFDNGVNRKHLNSNIHYNYIFPHTFRGNIHLFRIFTPEYLANKFIKSTYDIVISYLEGPTTRIVSGIQDLETIKINWVHSNVIKNRILKSYRNCKEFKRCYDKYNCTVFVSNTAKKTFENEMGLFNNHCVKYNTVETNQIKKQADEIIVDVNFDSNKLNLITVGRLTKVKGYDRLLKILKRLVNEKYNFHMYIIGEGTLRKKIKRYIYLNNLSDFITLLGYKDNPYKYVKKADIFICSSYSEGFSTAVTESLIVGTPVITTLCSGMEELLGYNNEYGIIVDNNEEALYNGLKEFLIHKDKLTYYQQRAETRGKDFETKNTVQKVEKILLNLTN